MTGITGIAGGRRAPLGFSLIEMLVALLLLGIVASLAWPAYNQHVLRAHRAQARAGLLQAAHRLEREATAAGAYPNAELPDALASVPGNRYRISRQKPADATDAGIRFLLFATPQGAQASDRCGTFTLSSAGERGLISNEAKIADCWNR